MRNRQTDRFVEALERATEDEARCLCPDPGRYPDWRDKACPVHGPRATRA